MATGFGAVGLGTTLAGGLLSAFGANKQGEAQQSMYNYRAQVAKINADINRQNATWALQKGQTEEVQFGMKAAQERGRTRAAMSASGIEVGTGSSAEVLRSQEKLKAIDQAQIRSNAAKIAYDYTTKAHMDEQQAGLDVMTGEYAKQAGEIKATESILGTISTVSSKWQQGKSTGLWG